ncbi:MAG: V-type ATP synthase subunit I [Firmicutes bacterium]|nr:V-type ATP synthase subunit I [Bacillota bacterium]
MSILKMKFISIVGRKDYFDEFVLKYVVNSGIELADALSKLENIKGLSRYADEEPHNDLVKRILSVAEFIGMKNINTENVDIPSQTYYTVLQLQDEVSLLEKEIRSYTELMEKYREELNQYFHMQKKLELLIGLDVDLDSFFNFEFIKFRFGRIPKKSYRQLQLYIDDFDAIVYPVSQDQDYVWLIYFTPKIYSEKVDSIFSSLYFERVRLSAEFKGTPAEALKQLKEKLSILQNEQKNLDENIKIFAQSNRERVINLYRAAIQLNLISEIRRYAACTKESFYITGWIPEDELNKLKPTIDSDKKVIYILEEPDMLKNLKPPIELKNNVLFKPFETLVRMYGLPSYNEIDPTAFVAVTYFLMFGLMFGDVGQGLVLLLAGLFLLKRKVSLGGVISGAGISSVVFGFLYGSVFGFEDWIDALWIRPMENINTMLFVAVIAGVLLITSAMVLNMINGIKSRNLPRIFFDKNGMAGFIFYWSTVILVLYFYKNNKLPFSLGTFIIILIIPILAMFFKEPFENYLHKREFIPKEKGVFFVQTFFELFDTILSYLSNTISFIRLSAFALNHAGLFMAIMILAGMTKGFGSIVEIVLGNILIIGLEGLIVGIQALRLEYYELFNRFFTGNGRAYKPLKRRNLVKT